MLNKVLIYAKSSCYLIILVLRGKILYSILEKYILQSRNQVFSFKKWKLVGAYTQGEFFSMKFYSSSNVYKMCAENILFCSTL